MKSKTYSHTIFASSPYGLAITDISGTFIDVNPVFAKLTGRTVKQAKELTYLKLSQTVSDEKYTEITSSILSHHKFGPIQDKYVHLDGYNVDVTVSATLLEDDGNELICWFVEEIIPETQSWYSDGDNKALNYDLLLSAAQAKSILSTAVDGIITITEFGIITSFNPAAEKMFGYSINEVLGNNISMLMPDPHRSQHDQYLSSYMNSGAAKIIGIGRETIAMRRDGSTFNIHLAVSKTIVDGKTLFTGIVRDITELKKTQRNLEISEERFRRSQRFANIGTWDWNVKTGELYWSERIFALFGYKEDELKTTYDNFLEAVHPDDRQYVKNSVNNCVYHGDEYNIEHRCILPDGTVKWMSERGDVVNDDKGEPSHMLGVVQDITLRKKAEHALLESEERFRGAFESASHGMAIVSIEGRWLKVNRSLCELTGYSEDILLSINLQNVTHSSDLEKCLVGMSKLLDKELDSFQLEKRFLHENGEVIWVHSSISLVRDLDDIPVHYIYQVIDISAPKKAESALKKAKEQAENANQAKSEFLSSMSHELRTPLNAVVGFSELLQESDNLDREQIDYLGEIKKASNHLLELINGILDLAKVESRQLDLTIEPINLAELVDQCCKLIRHQPKDKNIKILNKCGLNDKNIIPINGDITRCKQIILNLLTNAVKYNRDNGSVIISCQHSGDSRIRLSISDTGTGMSPEKVKNLFQPFNRLGAENSNIEGTGIGLVISKRLIEKMRGNIGVYSTENEGSTFWIEFERAKDTNLDSKKNKSVTSIKDNNIGVSNNPSDHLILVVEDNATSRILIKSQLEKLGYSADIASTGKEGLDFWFKKQYSAVLTDINLPDTDGIKLARRMNNTGTNNRSHVPIIAITANALEGDKEKFILEGLDDYIAKPIELLALDKTLKQWIFRNGGTLEDSGEVNIKQPHQSSTQECSTPIDLSIMTKYIGDDLELQQKLLERFRNNTPKIHQTFNKALANNDLDVIKMEAHKLKSTARTIGADPLGETCNKLEHSANDTNWQKIKSLVSIIHTQVNEVNAFLSSSMMIETNDRYTNNIANELYTLIIDDNQSTLEHTLFELENAGIKNLYAANNESTALEILHNKGIHKFNLVFLPYNAINGNDNEFLHYLSDISFRGNIILLSEENSKTPTSTEPLNNTQNLNILGVLESPVSSDKYLQLLNSDIGIDVSTPGSIRKA